ncbi:myosin heavy chain, cardiac muscle isoform-like isoform X1 [Quillaja saponaria]|uniref:Myosin heavy chain, cardiac muscle isoform-like isoform X1 n=1 Tax=Quillaja saponaria TaxID=32244 RepID=A0AAD7Q0D0_QUISA|nr:myosin heavy chain, cardiac muscle isoform-like isoform X1 [Quillaja saponaria]
MRVCCSEMTQNKKMIDSEEDQKLRWVSDIFPSDIFDIVEMGSHSDVNYKPHCEMGSLSGKKIEEGCLRTVESLRGRLLAERQASRVAKEDAEIMGNKLIELESKLREETKLKDRAERKLKFLRKKLESLNFSSISGKLEQSSSSEKCGNSCISSIDDSSFKDPEESEPKSDITNPVVLENPNENILKSRTIDPGVSEDLKQNVSEAYSPSQNHISPCLAKDSNFQNTDHSSSHSNLSDSSPEIICNNTNTSSGDLKNEENRSLSTKSSMVDNMDDHQDFVDNSMAIVPVNLPTTSLPTTPKPVNENVIEALVALRHAKEMLVDSMERRRMMIKVGPT